MRDHSMPLSLIAAFTLTATAAADSIRLRASVRGEPGATAITLSDIAQLDGDAAHALADIVVLDLEPDAGVQQITVREIRSILDSHGAHWGHLDLTGNTVTIRPSRTSSPVTIALDANAPVSVSPAAPTGTEAPLMDGAPLGTELAHDLILREDARGAIARFLLAELDIDSTELRIGFPSRELQWLDRSVVDQPVQIRTQGDVRASRVALRLQFWSNGAPSDLKTISLQPYVRTQTMTLARDIGPGETITSSDLREATEWAPAGTLNALRDANDILGRVATRRLRAGDALRHSDLEREELVSRNGTVVVSCLLGSIVIEMEGIAREDGALHDVIEISRLRERTTFLARVVGPGLVQVDESIRLQQLERREAARDEPSS